MSATATKEITIDHVGPIEHLAIPIPDGGGVVVLHGASGVGKSHAIASVASLTDGAARKNLRPSDGLPSGRIEGMGVTVRLGRSNTVRGELECESLESGIDPSLLVDPGIKDPLSADSKRLATLVRLANVTVDAGAWAAAIGKYADQIALQDLVSDDPVKSADVIRRRLHDLALKTERVATSKSGEATALAKSVADVEIYESNIDVDHVAVMSGIAAELAVANSKRDAYMRAVERRAASSEQLKSSHESAVDMDAIHSELKRAGIAAEQLQSDGETIKATITRLAEELEIVKETYRRNQSSLDLARAEQRAANARLVDAQEHQNHIRQLQNMIDESLPECVTAADIANIEQRKLSAIEQAQQAEVVRRAIATIDKSKLLARESMGLEVSAEEMRSLARSTDQVLEQALIDAGFDSIKVHDGRLCVESDRGLEPVSDLSTGERWRLALDLAAARLPTGALLSVHQEGWQSLDNDLRREVADMARERGLVIVTAQVDEGGIRAELV